jgi:hypothetical protein
MLVVMVNSLPFWLCMCENYFFTSSWDQDKNLENFGELRKEWELFTIIFFNTSNLLHGAVKCAANLLEWLFCMQDDLILGNICTLKVILWINFLFLQQTCERKQILGKILYMKFIESLSFLMSLASFSFTSLCSPLLLFTCTFFKSSDHHYWRDLLSWYWSMGRLYWPRVVGTGPPTKNHSEYHSFNDH